MRVLTIGAMALAPMLALSACGGKSAEERAEEDPALANYTPPFVMSRLDFGGVIERRFRRLDHNGDDKLMPDELAPRNRERIMTFDTNHDGAISVEEWSKGMLGRFDAQDANHDGTVTSDERDRAREQRDVDLPTPADEPANNTAAAT